jgi:hypothetical protein
MVLATMDEFSCPHWFWLTTKLERVAGAERSGVEKFSKPGSVSPTALALEAMAASERREATRQRLETMRFMIQVSFRAIGPMLLRGGRQHVFELHLDLLAAGRTLQRVTKKLVRDAGARTRTSIIDPIISRTWGKSRGRLGTHPSGNIASPMVTRYHSDPALRESFRIAGSACVSSAGLDCLCQRSISWFVKLAARFPA